MKVLPEGLRQVSNRTLPTSRRTETAVCGDGSIHKLNVTFKKENKETKKTNIKPHLCPTPQKCTGALQGCQDTQPVNGKPVNTGGRGTQRVTRKCHRQNPRLWATAKDKQFLQQYNKVGRNPPGRGCALAQGRSPISNPSSPAVIGPGGRGHQTHKPVAQGNRTGGTEGFEGPPPSGSRPPGSSPCRGAACCAILPTRRISTFLPKKKA